jgi:hypothetical protein
MENDPQILKVATDLPWHEVTLADCRAVARGYERFWAKRGTNPPQANDMYLNYGKKESPETPKPQQDVNPD